MCCVPSKLPVAIRPNLHFLYSALLYLNSMKSSWNSIVHLLLHCLFCLSIKDRIANYPNVISIGRILAHLEFFCSVFEFHRKRKPIFLFFFFIPLKSAYLMATVFISLLTPFLKLLSNPNFLWSYFQLMRIKIYKNCAPFSPSLSASVCLMLWQVLVILCEKKNGSFDLSWFHDVAAQWYCCW